MGLMFGCTTGGFQLPSSKHSGVGGSKLGFGGKLLLSELVTIIFVEQFQLHYSK